MFLGKIELEIQALHAASDRWIAVTTRVEGMDVMNYVNSPESANSPERIVVENFDENILITNIHG